MGVPIRNRRYVTRRSCIHGIRLRRSNGYKGMEFMTHNDDLFAMIFFHDRPRRLDHLPPITLDPEPDEQDELRQQWASLQQSIIEYMLARKKFFATQPFLNSMRVREGPKVSKEAMVSGLCSGRYLLQCPGSGKAESQYIPLLRTRRSLEGLIQHRHVACEDSLPELYNISSFADYMYKYRFRQENAELLAEVLQHMSSRKKTKEDPPQQNRRTRKICKTRPRHCCNRKS